MNACEDFFELTVTGHVIACAMELLDMSSIEGIPSSSVIPAPDEAWMKDDSERKSILMDVASDIVDKYVDLSTTFADTKTSRVPSDSVFAYSCEVLSLGLLFLEFKDSIKLGDGDRDMRVWKYLLLIFKACGRKNYAIEALTTLTQYHITLPPQLAEQLKWSRFINTHGTIGHNISCDLHMEHLNKVAKVAIDGLGANKSEKAITRVGKAIGTMTSTIDNFDTVNKVPAESGAHSKKSSEKDLNKVISQLVKSKVFDIVPGRKHKSFSNINTNCIRTLPEQGLKDWMIQHYANLLSASQ